MDHRDGGRRAFWTAVVALAVLATAACGGGAGGTAGHGGGGLVLVNFSHDGVDNVVLNAALRFDFSDQVDPGSVGAASIQIREGDAFGLTVPGVFRVQGSTVTFEPSLASLCDQSDSGFKPDTQYHAQLSGSPEEFSVRSVTGRPLVTTSTLAFHTRLENDPQKYADSLPGVGPRVVSSSPANGAAAVGVAPGNCIEIVMSENLDPCTVNEETVRVFMYESGDPDYANAVLAPNGKRSGFYVGSDVTDQVPGDPTTWGAAASVSYAAAPRRILCNLELKQDFSECRLSITPLQGYSPDPLKNASLFPENALLVVLLDYNITDYGGLPMTPAIVSFTTENQAETEGSYLLANDGETTYDERLTTAAVDPDPRAVSRIQGYMLFAGDGDNGSNPLKPGLPNDPASGCLTERQANDGTLDEFDPAADVLFDTGAVPNTCTNSTDGSTAVVWEFKTFRIRNGVTVRVIGVNPAIFLVQSDVVIDAGGRLLLRGDGQGGMPNGRGATGYAWTSYATAVQKGGIGVAGAGSGGDAAKFNSAQHGGDGFSGFGSPDGQAVDGGHGAGQGGTNHDTTYPSSPGTAQGGGGGGHAAAGVTSTDVLGPTHKDQGPTRGAGGLPYPTGASADRMLTPTAGSGGGAGGNEEWDGNYDGVYSTGGGAGGAGGGFVDITTAGDIYVMGTIDAAGSAAGDGGSSNYYAGPGGGGGGSGGGIRLLTPGAIVLGGTAVVTAAGGAGGYSPNGTAGAGGPQNHGGAGANGRIVMEDSDSLIGGLGAASVTPGEGDVGFYRGVFDATRFKGGGLTPQAVTGLIPIGTYAGFDPVFLDPVAADIKAGIPVGAAPGPGKTCLLIEARGYQMNADGTPDATSATSWVSVGYLRDSGVEAAPAWSVGHPGDVTAAPDNAGFPGGFTHLNALGGGGHEFLQLRVTVFLPTYFGPFDPGAYLDDWRIRFSYDQ